MLKCAVLMDPIASINVTYDSSLRLMREAQSRGWALKYLEANDLYLDQGSVFASLRDISVFDEETHCFELGPRVETPLSALDVVLMRKDPPFDINYVYLTYLLEMAESQGCYVINSPRALRDANEKLFTCWFSSLMAPTRITYQVDQARMFWRQHGAVVLKPLDLMGGRSIYKLIPEDPDTALDEPFQELSVGGKHPVMIQAFLPEVATAGDKRIFVIDGEPYEDVLVRTPQVGGFKANMASGGAIHLGSLSPRDREICAQVGPVLKKMGLLFVGLDVIGSNLSEINVTSPTGIVALEGLCQKNLAKPILDAVVRRLKGLV